MPPKRKALTAKNNKAGDAKVKEVQKSISEKLKTKSMGKKKSSKVDPLCGVAYKTEVYKENDEAWECMLNQTNIQNNNNKYFLLQLLVDPKSKLYFTWFRWGRVGYNGQNDLKQFNGNLEGAKNHFMKKFKDKTVNHWDERDAFEKVAGKYDLVDIQIGEDPNEDEVDQPVKKKSKKTEMKVLDSKLHVKVQQLIEMICDQKIMAQTLKNLDFDLDKAVSNRQFKGAKMLKNVQIYEIIITL